MRDIRFRAKGIASGIWFYGCPVFGPRDMDWGDKTWDNRAHGKYIDFYTWDEKEEQYGISLVDPQTLGQFTGLHDRNGREIYEGDIMTYVNRDEFMDVVEEKTITVTIQSLDIYIKTLSWIPVHGVIVGTIHDEERG